jgi:hypothetical protein
MRNVLLRLSMYVMNVMRKSTLTLTQSGLLTVLLEHQRRKVIESARRHARREHLRAVLSSTLTRPFRTLTVRAPSDDSEERSVETVPRHT